MRPVRPLAGEAAGVSADVLLTVKEYAALFRKHPETVRRRVRQRKMRYPVVREGRDILILVPSSLVARLSNATQRDVAQPST